MAPGVPASAEAPNAIKAEPTGVNGPNPKPRQRSRRKQDEAEDDPSKRRCVSSACIACRKRKSKCDGNVKGCAACSQVYLTECIYDVNSDHRRKGVYKNDIDNLKTRNSTLQTLFKALLNLDEPEAFDLLREIRGADSLDAIAEQIHGLPKVHEDEVPGDGHLDGAENEESQASALEKHIYGKMADLRLDEGSVRYIGGTSHLIHIENDKNDEIDDYTQQENPITSWTKVTDDEDLVLHLLNHYMTWHYSFFTTLSKQLFYRDFNLGYAPHTKRKTHYCTPLLVNAMLALGCHFTSAKGAREDPDDSATAGDHFFREAKRLILEGDLHEVPRLCTVQALALMSVREAGCAREAKGWVYSGMSFRMATDMGLNLNSGQLTKDKHVNGDEAEEDVRRITFWGCFLFDKCWSNYLGRLPQLPSNIVTVSKFDIWPDEDSEPWMPYTDSGFSQAHAQPSRTRAVALQISKLCSISNDLINYFYNPANMEKNRGKAAEVRMLSSIHVRLETWRRELPKEMEPREGGLSSILVMHMFSSLLFIHLFRPFLKYTKDNSPLPPTANPRKQCTLAAQSISKLMRLYKRSYGLRQAPNLVVYILHSACTLHILNLPDKNARRDIIHGVKHLEEIAEGWLCARRTLSILSTLARKWNVALPEEAATVLARTDQKFGHCTNDSFSPASQRISEMAPTQFTTSQTWSHTAGINSDAYPAASIAGERQGVAAIQSDLDSLQPGANANTMQASQYPATTFMPPDATAQTTDLHTTNSPNGMFGGYEQLLRVSQEWAMRDQTQLANGFEHWADMNFDPSVWAESGVPVDGGLNAAVSGAPVATGTSMPSVQMPMYAAGADVGLTDWLNGADPNNDITTYDENSWYN